MKRPREVRSVSKSIWYQLAHILKGDVAGLVAALVASLLIGAITGQNAITEAVRRGLHPPPPQTPWYQTVDWKQVGIVVAATVVAVLTFLKLLFETIKSALDVRDRLWGPKDDG